MAVDAIQKDQRWRLRITKWPALYGRASAALLRARREVPRREETFAPQAERTFEQERKMTMKHVAGMLLALMLVTTAQAVQAAQYAGYPPNAIPVVIDTGNVPTGPIATSMPAVTGWNNYLAAIACTGGGATAASNVLMVLGSFPVFPSGTVNLTWIYEVPVGATVAAPGVAASFNPPLVGQDSGAIALNVASVGAGNTHLSCNMRGYRLPTQP